MNSYEFTIVATGLPIDNDDWLDRFYEAGCDDALVGLQRGLFVLEFDREANTLIEAVESAHADVRRAGATIVRIEPDSLVSASDIAERAEVSRQAVSLYVNGERGEGFPTPVACVSGLRPLWKWSEVAAWLHAAGKIDHSIVEMAQLLDRLNAEAHSDNRPARAEVLAPVVVESEYVTTEFYTRRKIDRPKLRVEPPRGAARHRQGFDLRRTVSAQQMVQ
ncbi:MAG: hypothetical protein K2W81_13610 [Sphingomonas sp.]|uniref:hypothetical protein n=1 Tax=Sphingomonas sp. TaxID=28214 RepID=UPI0025DF3092|nr:hypothetical protein [Sphingomonas sp.]MBY0284982.1 hypothetical protein [Sphingomonas sp.]